MAARRGRTWRVLLVLGLLLVVYGGAVAAFLGPDSSVTIGTRTVPLTAAGTAVSTHPEITAFRNIDMEVTASAPSGVFLAASHRVDTESLLAERSHFEISKMFFGNVDGRMLTDGPPATYQDLRPDRLVGWSQVSPESSAAVRAASDGGRDDDPSFPEISTVVVPLGGAPVDVVAFPVSPEESVTFSLGVHSERAFVLHLALAALGGLLILVWWLLRRRRLRAAPPEAPRTVTPVAPPPTASTFSTRIRPPSPESNLPAPYRRTTLTAGLALSLGLTVAGCAAPRAVPVSQAPAARTAITLDEAAQVLDNAPRLVHALGFTAYPMWAVAEVPPSRDQPRTRLAVLTRDAFEKPWRKAGTVKIVEAAPPPGNPTSTVTDAVRAEAVAAGAAIAEFWMTGSLDGGTKIPSSVRKERKKLLRNGVDKTSLWVVGGAEEDVRIVPVVGGNLALISHRLHTPEERRLTSAVMLRTGRRSEVLGSTVASPGR
ncbi:hypothetical protein [Nocardioides yefusunii]|uniref:DUF3153 domain-containing protein n=1 Tax=Nocardioides yefusunii TaxID=2500546 RepID=A0ABW1QTT7_9ACTN|nr:hypothetical protein [Nocardioides yefusunii]